MSKVTFETELNDEALGALKSYLVKRNEQLDMRLSEQLENTHITLTEDGRREWSDVLNAKVTSIYEGHYGVQIGLTGYPAERLRDFSFMLAGHCPVEGYDRWVNSGEQEQAQTEPKQFM